jgi:hypothetical protein
VYNELIDFNGILLHVSAYEKPSSGRYTLITLLENVYLEGDENGRKSVS